MKPAAFYVLPAILLVSLIARSNTDDTIIDEDLLGVVLNADSLQTPDGKIVPGPDTLMTIQFNKELEVYGHAACNLYQGIYEIGDDRSLAIDDLYWTEMGCVNYRFLTLDNIFFGSRKKSYL